MLGEGKELRLSEQAISNPGQDGLREKLFAAKKRVTRRHQQNG